MTPRVRRLLAAGPGLALMVAPASAVAGDAEMRDLARRRAEDILGERRFQDPDLPAPLKGPLTWIGERIQGLLDFVFGPIAGLPGGVGWLILGAAVVLIVAVVALRMARQRAEVERAPGGRAAGAATASADELEREADACEARGDRARAVRLRFRAGLVRLARDGVIPRATAITNREVARHTGAPTFPLVARSFDEIAYGERPARDDDLRLSREGWAAVRGEAAARSRGGR